MLIFCFSIIFQIGEFRYLLLSLLPDSMIMIWTDCVPERESDLKSIVSPSSEGAEWATSARIH